MAPPATFPSRPADVTAAWLSSVLDTEVTDVTSANLGEGVGVMAEVSRLTLTYGQGSSGPATLILKTPSPAEQNLETATTFGFYSREVNFYQQLADRMDLRVPKAYFADMDPSSVPFCILMEEVTGARVIDQVVGGTLADAEKVVDAVARLHARWWNSPDLDELDWLPPLNNDAYKGYAEVMPQLIPVLQAKYGDRLEPEGMGVLEALPDLYTAYLDSWIERGQITFCHYDLRLDNILFEPETDPDGVCILDWQLAVKHCGTFDIGYYLGQNVSPTFRREHQDTLLRRYHDALTGLGVTGYSFDQCWDDYRRSMLMHVVSATQIAVLDGGNERGQQLLDAMVTSGWTAAVDLDSGDFLDELR